ncbi:VPLPA-CTERM sorting domain-containing protein [Maliponia aquimaris]|uniref:PEP-CTERM protein-sorting domain-containing protein n=1 Tax=Maliponia aquimaris TaxID=1673631 RepID=A0A238JZK1_9RHOB|nr:VPLPA-CTERM sorting domain-containing protein [Maliponia aquimaris]SMX36065.1 hypothetical protein MAA8898_00740 [Maliponia aquimaris]
MITRRLASAALAAGLFATAAQSGTISTVYTPPSSTAGFTGSVLVTEKSVLDGFVYDVDNATNGDLIGLGVSNNGTYPYLFGPESNGYYGCTTIPGSPRACFIGIKLEAATWTTTLVNGYIRLPTGTDLSFANIFGDFLTASGGNDTINWFWAVEGTIPSLTKVYDFFGFVGYQPESSIIGALSNADGVAFFTAGRAGVAPPPVPLPGAGWLMIAGLGGIAALRRRASWRADRAAPYCGA